MGDYASFLGLYKLFKKHCPDAQFSVLSRHPDDNFSNQFDVETLLNLDHSCKPESNGRIFNGFNEGDKQDHLHEIFHKMSRCDLLVLGNGRLFVDISLDFMAGPLSYFCILVMLAKFLNKPVVLYSVTLVQPRTEYGKKCLKFILQNAAKIIVREQFSALVAKQYIFDTEKVEVLPDIAFALDESDASGCGMPFEVDKNSMGVNFRGVSFSNAVGAEQLAKMTNRVTVLLDSTDKKLVFCNQGTYDIDSDITDDRKINQRVFQQLKPAHQTRCTLSNVKLSLANILYLYQKLDYLFTTRRHGFILSLTQATRSSLVCDEDNTAVMEESIPIRELYIRDGAPFIDPRVDFSRIEKYVSRLGSAVEAYPEKICEPLLR